MSASKQLLNNTVVGVLNQFPPFPLFFSFFNLAQHALAIEYHVYIWRMTPQLSCGDTCKICMWFKESNRYSCEIENVDCRQIYEQSFSTLHPMFNLLLYLDPWWLIGIQITFDDNWNRIYVMFIEVIPFKIKQRLISYMILLPMELHETMYETWSCMSSYPLIENKNNGCSKMKS